jgi:hypothetical protein
MKFVTSDFSPDAVPLFQKPIGALVRIRDRMVQQKISARKLVKVGARVGARVHVLQQHGGYFFCTPIVIKIHIHGNQKIT